MGSKDKFQFFLNFTNESHNYFRYQEAIQSFLQMNPVLILMYGGISVSCFALMTIIIKYLKQKAIPRQQIKDQVLSDLAFITGGTVSISAFISAVREVTGPFQSLLLVNNLFVIYQYLYGFLLSCTVSLQLVQVFNIFFTAWMSEWSDEQAILCHRIFVAVLGTASSSVLCLLKGGMCRPTALYYYLLQGYQEPDEDQTQMHSIWLAVFISVIIACQLAIEVKRCTMRLADKEADQLALKAMRQMEEATMKLTRQIPAPTPAELEVNALPKLIKVAWQDPPTQLSNFKRSSPASQDFSTRKEQAIKVARFVSLYGIFPAMVTIFNMSVSGKYGYRPHASTGSFLTIYGVVIPLSIIISNPKMKAFAKSLIRF